HHERGPGHLQQPVGLLRTFLETTEDRVEGRNEGPQIGQELGTDDLADDRRHQVETRAQQPERPGARRCVQKRDEFAVQEPPEPFGCIEEVQRGTADRKSTRLNSSHVSISYAVFCLKKKKKMTYIICKMNTRDFA